MHGLGGKIAKLHRAARSIYYIYDNIYMHGLGGKIAKMHQLYTWFNQYQCKFNLNYTSKASVWSCNFAVVKHLQRILEYYWLSVTELVCWASSSPLLEVVLY